MEQKYVYLIGTNVLNYDNGFEVQIQKVEILKETEKAFTLGSNKEARTRLYKSELDKIIGWERIFTLDIEKGLEVYKKYLFEKEEYYFIKAMHYLKRIKSLDKISLEE